jgi:hypothetical protein
MNFFGMRAESMDKTQLIFLMRRILEALVQTSEPTWNVGGVPETYLWMPISSALGDKITMDDFYTILEHLKRMGYITRGGNLVGITPKGEDLVKRFGGA